MMKTIGIKLADGSFYPILRDNKPTEKILELTTVHNNQTKIMVDLYRSEACKMKDAEYIDSLQIENLTAHPNGEPVITFTVSIDKKNNLSAKIQDKETGNQNSIDIVLPVNKTKNAAILPDDDITNDDDKPAELAEDGVRVLKEAGPGLLATAEALLNKEEEKKDLVQAEVEPEVQTEIEPETPSETEVQTEVEVAPEAETEPEPEVESEPEAKPEPEAQTEIDVEAPAESIPEPAAEPEPAPEPEPEVEAEVETKAEPALEDFNIEAESDPLPDFDENNFNENSFNENVDNEKGEIMKDLDDKEDAINSLDLPDFNLPDETEESEGDTALPDFNFDLPEEDDTSSVTEEETPNFDDFDIPESDPAPATNAGFDFAGLYDDNSILEEKEEKRHSKVPLIICIICAIICLLATAAILFVIPSKYNLLTRNAKTVKPAIVTEEMIEKTEEPEPEPEAEEEVLPEPEPEPEPELEAQEEEIVVIEKAEEVIPQQPPVLEEKPKNIVYKIKWGDTLWDIANTYYKNPWRYKEIAKYNGIKDPDHIVSGTVIEIPAE